MLEPIFDLPSLPEPSITQKPRAFDRPSFTPATRAYFDSIGRDYFVWREKMAYYVSYSRDFLKRVIPPQKKVLMVGCISAEILSALDPAVGVGVDISPEIIQVARAENTNPQVTYFCALPENLRLEEKFDYIVLVNCVDYSEDLLVLVNSLKRFVHSDTRICFSMLNPLWHNAIRLASRLKIRIPDFQRNLVAARALSTALEIKRFRVLEICRRVLLPKKIPLLSWLCNQFLSRLPVLNSLCFIQYVIAKPETLHFEGRLSCTVIVPCFNEEGNIAECIERIPKLGSFTEILVVNDGSRDGTADTVRGLQHRFPNLNLITYEKNRGKGHAVQEGMRKAKGDIMIILDADMTVPPEELVEFYEAIDSGAADFVSGTRFLYPMEREAMRWANYVGNLLFSRLVQIIVGSPCSDTLCGTKAMRRKDFDNFRFEDSRWGDFDLIFHAARLKLKSVQIPVHYRSRVAGESKMKAFSSGISFLRLCLRKWAELP